MVTVVPEGTVRFAVSGPYDAPAASAGMSQYSKSPSVMPSGPLESSAMVVALLVLDPSLVRVKVTVLVSPEGNSWTGFLELPAGVKGYVWINGFCLGRYWNRGPQRRLYLPWPLLQPGGNQIVVLELDADGEIGPLLVRGEPDLGARAGKIA